MMLNQPQGGHIFNIDGAGSDGRPTPRYIFSLHHDTLLINFDYHVIGRHNYSVILSYLLVFCNCYALFLWVNYMDLPRGLTKSHGPPALYIAKLRRPPLKTNDVNF